MGSYLDLLGACARVCGGTQPTLAQLQAGQNGIGEDLLPADKASLQTKHQPYWYSGADVGDSSGVLGLTGCYSLPTEVFGSTPFGMVLPNLWMPWEKQPFQGRKNRIDDLRLRIMVGSGDLMTLTAQLVDFADLVPAAFDAHAQLFATLNVGYVEASAGRFLEVEWGGKVYFALEFTLATIRSIPVSRTA